jgi:serine/threonine protein kinase
MTSHELLQGQMLGQYQLQDIIGQGEISCVYRARQLSIRRELAIKVFPPAPMPQFKVYERFQREVGIVAQLEHAYIVPVYDYGVVDQISYIAMRLLTGGTLSDRMLDQDNKPRLPSLGEAEELLRQVASALDYAHGRGIFHGNLNPGNILFDADNNPYLVDFAIARLTHSMFPLTEQGMIMGTPAYMSPEQGRGELLTSAADQYALGVILYQLIAGRLPFEGSTPYALMYKHLNEQPTPLRTWRKDVPEAVSAILLQALAKTPEERFPNITNFFRAFERSIRDTNAKGEPTNFFELSHKTAPI